MQRPPGKRCADQARRSLVNSCLPLCSTHLLSAVSQAQLKSLRYGEDGPQEETAHHGGALGSAQLAAVDQVGRWDLESRDANPQ